MSVIFKNDIFWGVNNSFSAEFFELCQPYLDKFPEFKEEIEFCIMAQLDTLDLREANTNKLRSFLQLAELAIADFEKAGDKDFIVKSAYTDYLKKIKELKDVVLIAIKQSRI